jgi:hypothetical protein
MAIVRNSDAFVRSLHPDTTPIHPSPIYLGQGDSPSYSDGGSRVDAADMGGDGLLVWDFLPSGAATVMAALQSSSDWPRRSRPVVIVGSGSDPAAAASSVAGLVVWVGDNEILAVRVDAAAWPQTSPPQILAAGSDVHDPDVAYSDAAGVYLAVWGEGNSALHGRLMNGSGMPIGTTLPLGTVSTAAQPVVSWNGTQFCVAWSNDGMVEMIRVLDDGTILDSTPIVVAGPKARSIHIDAREGECLVAWLHGDSSCDPYYEIRGARVTDAGQVLDPGGFMFYQAPWTLEPWLQSVSDVCWDGSRYHVV